MNYQELFSRYGRSEEPARVALIGVGQFGRTLLMQSRRMDSLELAAMCDLKVENLIATCREADLGEDCYAIAESPSSALRSFEAGKVVLTEDPHVAISLPVDAVVEATGNAEAGAKNALTAIDQGRNLVLVTKETDSAVGPILAHKARQAGLVLSQVDGDQPSLLLGLLSWARALGLEVSCAGKASEYDFVLDPDTATVRAEGFEGLASFDPNLWSAEAGAIGELLRQRAESMSNLPQRTPPDYCELCIVANASGLKPDRPEMHAPVARTVELPDLFRPRESGGILGGAGRLDIFNCLRRPDEISFAGGVFAVLLTPDAATGRLFKSKGIPVSDCDSYVLVYNPTHLLGVEAPLSILVPQQLGLATGSSVVKPVCDLGIRAAHDLPAGALLQDKGSHHRIEGTDALLLDYAALADHAPVPYYMASGHHLKYDVCAGEVITMGVLSPPRDSLLWKLRAEQDHFFQSM